MMIRVNAVTLTSAAVAKLSAPSKIAICSVGARFEKNSASSSMFVVACAISSKSIR